MTISCHCIANVCGNCVAEKCAGEIVGFDAHISDPEQAKRLYEAAVSMFEEEFS